MCAIWHIVMLVEVVAYIYYWISIISFHMIIVARRDGHSFSCLPKKMNQKKGTAVGLALRVPD